MMETLTARQKYYRRHRKKEIAYATKWNREHPVAKGVAQSRHYFKRRLYYILRAIQQRCNNPKNRDYRWYGAKGIRCYLTLEELEILFVIYNGASLIKPSVDRIDSKGDYTFSNVQFIELSENVIKANAENRERKLHGN
jgi:hypothetical protein